MLCVAALVVRNCASSVLMLKDDIPHLEVYAGIQRERSTRKSRQMAQSMPLTEDDDEIIDDCILVWSDLWGRAQHLLISISVWTHNRT